MIDVTLSSRFSRSPWLDTSVVDPRDFRGFEEFTVGRDWVDMAPGEFLLGESVGEVYVPADSIGILMPRSTYLRCGLWFGAGFVRPGWRERLVLELGNLNPARPLRLHIGDVIARVLVLPADEPLYKGKYACSNPMRPL